VSINMRRVRAIVRKEFREYRRNRSLIWSMAIFPLIFCIQPLIAVFELPASATGLLTHEHVLLYLLGIPALVPVFIAAYAVVGERQQGTLEPVLTTPIPREEFLLGKALAALLPSLVVAYAVFALFLACVGLLAQPPVASALIQVPDLLLQVLFTPLLAVWSIWVGIAISARSSDIRVAQQLSVLASLPSVLLVVLVALNVIPLTPGLAVGLAVVLLVLDGLGWRITSRLFDRERLVTGSG
jgi:ABC-type transport system involved in multi-copper enzyme maturation permease subunit